MGSNPIGTAIPYLNYNFIMKTIFYFITTLILISGCANIEEVYSEDSANTKGKIIVYAVNYSL